MLTHTGQTRLLTGQLSQLVKLLEKISLVVLVWMAPIPRAEEEHSVDWIFSGFLVPLPQAMGTLWSVGVARSLVFSLHQACMLGLTRSSHTGHLSGQRYIELVFQDP